jgi:predicted ArsR family transcriptional regulator
VLVKLLRAQGYEPFEDSAGIRLRNCPFGDVAADYPALVCGLNLALIQGCIAGLASKRTAILDPQPGACCVAIQTPPASTEPDPTIP